MRIPRFHSYNLTLKKKMIIVKHIAGSKRCISCVCVSYEWRGVHNLWVCLYKWTEHRDGKRMKDGGRVSG